MADPASPAPRSAFPLGACALAWALAAALTVPAASQQHRLRLYEVDDGLPCTEIHDLAQDDGGRLWLSCHSGVAVYDGLAWQSFGIAAGLAWSDQIALRIDEEGTLWSISARQPYHVYRRAGDSFELFSVVDEALLVAPPQGQPELTGFVVWGGGRRVVVATRDHGLLLRGEDAAWRRVAGEAAAPSHFHGLAVHEGQVRVATEDGLWTLGADGALVREPGLPPSPIYGLAEAGGGVLWLVGERSLGRWSGAGYESVAEGVDWSWPAGPRRPHLAPDARGGLYLGHGHGLLYFHPQDGVERIQLAPAAENVQALLLDREGIVWAATPLDLVKLASRRFTIYSLADGLLADDVTAILERRDHSMAFGHRGGLTLWDDGVRRTLELPLSAESGRVERVRDLAEDTAGQLWLAGDGAGLLHLEGGKLGHYGPAQGLDGAVGAVLVDARGRLSSVPNQTVWAGTDQGLYRQEGQRFVQVLGGLRIRRLAPAGDGGLWLATAEGLRHWRDGQLQAWSCEPAALCESIFAVLEDADGEVRVGGANGLLCARPGHRLEPCPAPRITAPIFWLARRPTGGELWLGSGDGVYRWRGADLHLFSVRHGIAGRELHRAAGVVDSQERVWIGTDRGVSRFDGRHETRAAPPIAKLLEVVGADQHFPLDAPVHFAAGDNDLIFRFGVVSLLDEAHTEVRFRLAGLENEWRPLPTPLLQEARYYDVPPGRYHFELQAANADEVWGDVLRSAQLEVALPYYRQPWFFGLAVLLFGASAFAVQAYLGQRNYSRRLETEVAKRVKELHVSENRYRQTFQGIDDGIVTTDGDGRVILLNPRAEALTGWPAREAVGRSAADILRLRREKSSEEAERSPLALGDLGPSQTALLEPREGERRLIEISAAPVGEDAGLVYALRDIGQRRVLEEELGRAQRIEAIGLLAGGIAHDFNNLLTVLLGNISLLRELLKTHAVASRSLADAENALGRARDLTQQLLTFARGGAPVRKAASIADILRDSSSFALRGSNVRCELVLPGDLPVVEVDAGQISQVVHNLLINASQAMPGGGIVRIAASASPAPNDALAAGSYVRIDVADQGTGIAEELLPRIFDPYFSTKADGRGLGLASAYSIVKRHEGLLTVRSTVGRGTTFSMYLPASAEAPIPAEEHAPASFVGSGRILVMDDDEIVQRTAGALLKRLGFEVATAGDGREALDLYAQAQADGAPFRAVLMDLTVPGGMGGQQAIKRLRDLDPQVLSVVYSGYSNDPVLANYRAYGFAGRLSKPFRLEDLAAALGDAFAAGPPT